MAQQKLNEKYKTLEEMKKNLNPNSPQLHFLVPPIYTGNWDSDAWARWYFSHGVLKT